MPFWFHMSEWVLAFLALATLAIPHTQRFWFRFRLSNETTSDLILGRLFTTCGLRMLLQILVRKTGRRQLSTQVVAVQEVLESLVVIPHNPLVVATMA